MGRVDAGGKVLAGHPCLGVGVNGGDNDWCEGSGIGGGGNKDADGGSETGGGGGGVLKEGAATGGRGAGARLLVSREVHPPVLNKGAAAGPVFEARDEDGGSGSAGAAGGIGGSEAGPTVAQPAFRSEDEAAPSGGFDDGFEET